jgi:DNA-binding IclR family transcriptional regulator
MRNSTMESAPDEPPGGVIAVTRALSLMEAFTIGEAALSLAELSRRAKMHKTTALRLARTLALSNYMVQTDDGLWRLGPAAGWLGARYQAGFDVNNVVEPALHELVKATGESASFYVREGDIRSCVARVEGPQSVRHNVRIGERLPLNKGAPGRVILAFSGATGEPYEAIRERGFHISMGERESEVSSVAAPVFALNWRLLGSMCISGPTSRLTKAKLEKHAKSVIRAANQLSYALAGGRSAATPKAVSKWHP